MAFYHRWAMRVLGGEWTDGRAFYGLPGYPFLLAGLYRLFGVQFVAVAALQSLLDAGTAVAVFLLARLCLGKPGREGSPGGWPEKTRAALPPLAALAWAAYQPSAAFSLILMPSSWSVAAFWGTVLLVASRRQTGAGAALGIGFVAGLAATAVATVLAALPVAAAGILGSPTAWRGRLAALAALAVGAAAGTSPCWLHNLLVARDPVFLSAHSGLNLYAGNHPGATGYPAAPAGMRATQAEMLADSIRLAEEEAGRPLRRGEVSRHWAEKARRWSGEHRAEWLALAGRKLANFWSAYEYDDLSALAIFRAYGLLAPGTTFAACALFGLPGLALALARGNRAARLAALGVLVPMAMLLPVFVTERYRLLAAPGLFVLSARFLQAAASACRPPRPAALAGLGLLLAGAGVAVFRPGDRPRPPVHDLHNVGSAALKAGDLATAEAKLLAAGALRPGDAEIRFATGNLRARQGDFYRAKLAYRSAVELDPRHARAWHNLAAIALAEGRPDLAKKFVGNALALDPGDEGSRHLERAIGAIGEDVPGGQLPVR
jgi:tetratricopeptide (TPR) repeat protein